MFSKACEYAIRAAIFLSANSGDGVLVGISDISSEIGAPKHFTAKILQVLTRKRLVSSQKGVNGGFYLDAVQKGRPVIDIVIAIDGDNIFKGCGLGLRECSEKEPCPLHHKFLAVRSGLTQLLTESTIGSLAHSLESGSSFLKKS